MLQLPLGSLALSSCTLARLDGAHVAGGARAWRIPALSEPERQFQRSPGRSHCSCIIVVRAQGAGKPFGFLLAIVPAGL